MTCPVRNKYNISLVSRKEKFLRNISLLPLLNLKNPNTMAVVMSIRAGRCDVVWACCVCDCPCSRHRARVSIDVEYGGCAACVANTVHPSVSTCVCSAAAATRAQSSDVCVDLTIDHEQIQSDNKKRKKKALNVFVDDDAYIDVCGDDDANIDPLVDPPRAKQPTTPGEHQAFANHFHQAPLKRHRKTSVSALLLLLLLACPSPFSFFLSPIIALVLFAFPLLLRFLLSCLSPLGFSRCPLWSLLLFRLFQKTHLKNSIQPSPFFFFLPRFWWSHVLTSTHPFTSVRHHVDTIHACVCVCVSVYVWCVYVCVCACMCARVCMHAWMHPHTHIHTRDCVCLCVCLCVCVFARKLHNIHPFATGNDSWPTTLFWWLPGERGKTK